MDTAKRNARTQAKARKDCALIDEDSRESFPASDPPAFAGMTVGAPVHKKRAKEKPPAKKAPGKKRPPEKAPAKKKKPAKRKAARPAVKAKTKAKTKTRR